MTNVCFWYALTSIADADLDYVLATTEVDSYTALFRKLSRVICQISYNFSQATFIQQNVLGGHVAHLAFEFELLDDLLHVGAEAIQVVFKIGLQDG